MIEYINKRLNEWAALVKRRDDGGLGYPGSTSYCQLVQIHGSGGNGAMIDAAAIEIDGIVCRLRKENPDRYEVAKWFYLMGNHTIDRIAVELHCSRATVFNRLHALHLAVQEALFDLEIEAQDKRQAERERNQMAAVRHA